ncbi:MAG: tRNA (5-methylaminomethyl-2-thiouridine)(34)-methyltransferase MnmD [Prevotellaceae bacterium]|jgi:tRNA U34 5-methylaminomethyl-2-thiouridine-forming methyltransferase MnmC|nr:tRNA (5-methylaminomethyl-2-thiouridine)(34)-methyltransferase MnmD [Prevotellaceae bacterium]
MYILEKTADGSHTFFVPELNEHYHSVNGALTESRHVFINAGLNQIEQKEISVLEIGFGTGLNAILTCLEAKSRSIPIHYTGIELYPIDKKWIKMLNFPDEIDMENSVFDYLHDCEWNKDARIDAFFTLHKIKGDLTKMRFNRTFDLIYFDAFAPEKQPEMWSPEIFSHLFNQTNPNGILTTYCAKGSVRRMLQTAGYETERLPGPPGKREMLRARKL